MNLFKKQKKSHRLRKQTYDYQSGKVGGRDKLGFGDWQIHTTISKLDNQQVPTV